MNNFTSVYGTKYGFSLSFVTKNCSLQISNNSTLISTTTINSSSYGYVHAPYIPTSFNPSASNYSFPFAPANPIVSVQPIAPANPIVSVQPMMFGTGGIWQFQTNRNFNVKLTPLNYFDLYSKSKSNSELSNSNSEEKTFQFYE